MKAAVIYEYGGPGVFRTEDIPEPVLRKGEILIRVHAAAVNPVDWKQRKGNHKFFLKAKFPVVPGYDVSGVVERCHPDCGEFKPGDEVYSRLRRKFGGAFAELAAAPVSATALKPAGIDHLQAAGIPLAGQTALQALRDKANLQPGMRLLIIGAAGGVGHFALQIAKQYDAHITAVCSSNHMELLEKLKPDRHIDYRYTAYLDGTEKFDVILDAAGKETFLSCRKALDNGGLYISLLPRPKILAHKMVALFSKGKRVRTLLQRPRSNDLRLLAEMVDEGRLEVIIDSVYPLEEVSEAHRRAEEYSTEGKIIIKVV